MLERTPEELHHQRQWIERTFRHLGAGPRATSDSGGWGMRPNLNFRRATPANA